MNEQEAFQRISEFEQKIRTNRAIRLSFNGKEFRLTRNQGQPPDITPTHFALVTWPTGTHSGFFGFTSVMGEQGPYIFDSFTTDSEVCLLVAATELKDLEAVFNRMYLTSEFSGGPAQLSGWMKGPGRTFSAIPFYVV